MYAIIGPHLTEEPSVAKTIGMVQWWKAIELDRASKKPLYQQLQALIRSRIEDGGLSESTKLPASRDLAAQLLRESLGKIGRGANSTQIRRVGPPG